MIISHQNRFIFVRTEKTAGTSIEHALAQLCGPDDIVTGISASSADQLNVRTAWTKRVPFPTGSLRKGSPRLFGLHTHASAAQAKSILGSSIFNSYFKFAVERNPWDRQVSLYYQRSSRQPRNSDFDADMNSLLYRLFHHTRLKNWEKYTINDQIVVDEVLRYEDLAAELARVTGTLGLPRLELGQRRSGSRPSLSFRGLYTERTKQLIGDWYRRR